jgi:hypothetical protein
MSIDPKAPPIVIVLNKKSVAWSQVEEAITIWAKYGDPVSILTLAKAANECYKALAGHIGKPSYFETWLRSKSKAFQDRTRYVINWVKHGRDDMKKKPKYHPIIAEALIFDSIECHAVIFGSRSHLMGLFVIRYSLEHPSESSARLIASMSKSLGVNDLLNGDRTEFFQKALERLSGS